MDRTISVVKLNQCSTYSGGRAGMGEHQAEDKCQAREAGLHLAAGPAAGALPTTGGRVWEAGLAWLPTEVLWPTEVSSPTPVLPAHQDLPHPGPREVPAGGADVFPQPQANGECPLSVSSPGAA